MVEELESLAKKSVWKIVSEVSTQVAESMRGNMLSSSSTTSMNFLDGRVSVTYGYFDASSGMHWPKDHVKAYIIYKLGFDAKDLLKSKSVPSIIELDEEIKKQSNDAKKRAGKLKSYQSRKELKTNQCEFDNENKEKIKVAQIERDALKISGPEKAHFIFEADIWEDFLPTTYRCYIEAPNELIRDYRLWEKTDGCGWELTALKVSGTVGLQEAARQFLVKYFGQEMAYNVVRFEAGPIIGKGEFKDLIRFSG